MSCILCFGIERDECLLDIASAENLQLNIAFILYTHFKFCFQVSAIWDLSINSRRYS